MANHPVDRHVGARLKVLRLQRHLSQKDIADSLGLTFQQVQKYEKGTNRISASRLFELSALLNIPISAFFSGLSSDAPLAPDTSPLLSSLDYEILALLSQVDDGKVKRQVRALLRELSSLPSTADA